MIRLGIVDFDSSHSIEFTRRFNQVGIASDQFVHGARVVVGCPGQSEMSPERIAGFAAQVRECEVELVDSPDQMFGRIDAVLILSLCGAAHLERVRPFLQAGVPAFVDKPFACSLADAQEMLRLADQNHVALFSASGMRFAEELEQFRQHRAGYGQVFGAMSYGPAKRAHGNPGLLHYGIHAVEMLIGLMGPGCERVSTTSTDAAEVVTAQWLDGRIAGVRGNRQGSTAYGFVAFCEHGVLPRIVSTRYSYRNLCREIVKTFQTRTPAVGHQDALEVIKFILASLKSEQHEGDWVRLESMA